MLPLPLPEDSVELEPLPVAEAVELPVEALVAEDPVDEAVLDLDIAEADPVDVAVADVPAEETVPVVGAIVPEEPAPS